MYDKYMFSSAHPAAHPTIIHRLLDHKYGSQQRRIFIIPHRLKNFDESKAIIGRVEKAFWQAIKDHKFSSDQKVVSDSLLLTELIELLIQVVHESDYIYNQDVFIGIDFQQSDKQDEIYVFDEIAEDVDSALAVRYYLQIVNTYNPLLIINPFGSQSETNYHALTQDAGDTTLIGQTISDHSLTRIKNISDNIHGHCVVIDSTNDISAIKQLKLKAIIDSTKLKNPISLEDLKKSDADFIIS
jgi:enolase